MYIGNQKIVSEATNEGNFVKVTLEVDTLDQLGTETEEVYYHKDILPIVRTVDPIDATQLQDKRCDKIIEDIVLTLIKYNAYLYDVDYIFRNASNTILQAKLKKERKFYKNNEHKRTVYQFIDELLKD